jgi:hypothetical protein
MKELDITPETLVRNPEHRRFLARVWAYVFALFCLLPMVTGLVMPFVMGLTDVPAEALAIRLATLIATGTAAAVVVFLPVLLVLWSRWLRLAYVFLLFPLSMVTLGTQVIMYLEFGTEIDTRFFGLFQGNLSALWIHAKTEYGLHWVLAVLAVLSVGLALKVSRTGERAWRPRNGLSLGVGLMALMMSAVALALAPSVSEADHFHPTKISRASLFQMGSFLGTHYFVGHRTGYDGIMEGAGELTTDTYGELAKRLGEEPGRFVARQVERPAWLRKKPSHVFLFLMESIEHDLVENPVHADIVPYIRRYAEEGLVTPNFSCSSGVTVDAVHAMVGGVGAQEHYPVARALERFPMDTLPKVMKRAGYGAWFYAASRREFGEKGDVCEAYGYDRFFGCPDEVPEMKSNEWGVADGDFFEWALEEIEGLSGPQFISFLNVSNHTPFDSPVHEMGEVTISEETLEMFVGRTREDKVTYALHMRYADWKMGQAVEELRSRHPEALFVFVGDHNSKRLRNDPLQQVPFVLWNDRVIDSSVDTTDWFGSHMDIVATLASLVLPDGEAVTTLGQPVWFGDADRVSSAGHLIVTGRGYLRKRGRDRSIMPTTSFVTSAALQNEEAVYLKCSAIDALSWGFLNDRPLPEKVAEPEVEADSGSAQDVVRLIR